MTRSWLSWFLYHLWTELDVETWEGQGYSRVIFSGHFSSDYSNCAASHSAISYFFYKDFQALWAIVGSLWPREPWLALKSTLPLTASVATQSLSSDTKKLTPAIPGSSTPNFSKHLLMTAFSFLKKPTALSREHLAVLRNEVSSRPS